MRRPFALALLLLCAAAAPGQPPAELRGTLELVQDGKRLAQGAQEAVVFFTPARGGAVAPGRPVEMVTLRKEFQPRLLVVPVGTKVRFPNQDPILHNVFSVSPGNAFDVGLYKKGAGKEVTFLEPGLVRVFCNVHQSMTGYVLVVDTPHSVSPDARGAFHLAGLPPGPRHALGLARARRAAHPASHCPPPPRLSASRSRSRARGSPATSTSSARRTGRATRTRLSGPWHGPVSPSARASS